MSKILDFDKATDYLTELLSRCDAGVLAECINLAAYNRNKTGTPPTTPFQFAKPLDGQEIELVPDDHKVEISVTLNDAGDGDGEIKVRVQLHGHGIDILPDGYGDSGTMPGHGVPVYLELYDSELVLRAWSDINKEDPTHIISLEGARESNREQGDEG